MPIYIYRSGSGAPQPDNPFKRFLVSLAVFAALVGLGVLLLPVLGIVALIVLVLIAGGLIYRMIYGDPFERARNRMREQMAQAMRAQGAPQPHQAPPSSAAQNQSRFTSRAQTQEVEDAVIVEEKPRQD